jgi:tetratricopeptide (TPR) repeat protein
VRKGRILLALWLVACGWNPSRPFDREAPPVKEALVALDAGDATAASELLEHYLETGACADGKIGAPDSMKTRPNGSFDLGLALFRIGEAYGRRFGEEEIDAGVTQEAHAQRVAQIDCALRIVQSVAADDTQPIDLRARARYLEGNLHFLGAEYEQAVAAYDKALTLAPGMVDAGDEVGRDAAFNRAIALRRIEDKKNDAGGDAAPNDSGAADGSDGGSDGGNDGGNDSGGDSGGGDDGGKDSGAPEAGNDAGPQSQNEPDAEAPPPPPTQTQDDRILDQLESAPTFQQEAARKMAAQRRHVRGMVDK